MRRGGGAQGRLVQRIPLAAGAQHKEDGVHRRAPELVEGPAPAGYGSPAGGLAAVAAVVPSPPTIRPTAASHHRGPAFAAASHSSVSCLTDGDRTGYCLVRLRHKIFMSLNWFINFKASILKKINLFKWL